MTQRDEGHDFRDSKNKAMEYERKQKYEAIIDMVIRWLDSNIDEWQANDLLNDPRIEIKNAVAKAYGVEIESVKTMNYPVQRNTKYTKSGIVQAMKGAYKKAIVQLAEGESIDFYSNI